MDKVRIVRVSRKFVKETIDAYPLLSQSRPMAPKLPGFRRRVSLIQEVPLVRTFAGFNIDVILSQAT